MKVFVGLKYEDRGQSKLAAIGGGDGIPSWRQEDTQPLYQARKKSPIPV